MRGNSPVRFGKGPTEKDPHCGHLAGGLLHSEGGPGKRTGGNTSTAPGAYLTQGWGPHTISGCPMDGRPRESLLRLIGKSGTSPAGLIMLFPSDVGRRQLRWFDG